MGINRKSDKINEEKIIKSLGDFENEKNILKKYARRGQCFSTTKFICKLSEENLVFDVPDITRNGYNFTDGCGMISPELAAIITEQYGVESCAFQVRIAGAKGILMVDPSLEGK